MAIKNNSNSHRWRFFRAGGVDQVQIRDGNDIANLGSLDQKLWMALAVPTRGNELDPIRLRPTPHEFALYYDV